MQPGSEFTAEDFERLKLHLVRQGTSTDEDQSAPSTAFVDSLLVVPVAWPLRIGLNARYTSGGGGIAWKWAGTGTVYARRVVTTYGLGSANIDGGTAVHKDLLFSSAMSTPHFTTATTPVVKEELRVEGVGLLTFQFAQAAQHAQPTKLLHYSWLTYQGLWD